MQYHVLTIDLLRHGEPEGGSIFRGSTDSILTAKGWDQMHKSLELPKEMKPPWDTVIYSPLLRCKQFAEQFSEKHQLCSEPMTDLKELHFGDWEGLSFESLDHQDSMNKFWEDPINNTPPNGESIIDFHQRMTTLWKQLLDKYIDSHLLIISHGGSIRSIIIQVLGIPIENIQRINVPYACLSQIQIFRPTIDRQSTSWQQLNFHQGSYLKLVN